MQRDSPDTKDKVILDDEKSKDYVLFSFCVMALYLFFDRLILRPFTSSTVIVFHGLVLLNFCPIEYSCSIFYSYMLSANI